VHKYRLNVSFVVADRLHDEKAEHKDDHSPRGVITQSLRDVGLLWDLDFFLLFFFLVRLGVFRALLGEKLIGCIGVNSFNNSLGFFMFVVVSALLLYFDLGWFFYLKTFQHGAFIFIEFELLSLLLSYDGLFVELDDSNEPNQSDDSNDPRNSSSSCSLGEICRTLLLEHFFSYYEFPYPSTVRDHTQSRDDV
jgi:hypothetical protein